MVHRHRTLGSSTTYEDKIQQLLDGPTPTLTPSPPPLSTMSEHAHNIPPHINAPPEVPASPPPASPLPASPPPEAFDPELQQELPAAPPLAPIDPHLQNAMTALIQAMAAQFQQFHLGMADTPSPILAHCPVPAVANRSRIKTRDPNPYDGSDSTKLRAFLSQCKLVFRSRPDDSRQKGTCT